VLEPNMLLRAGLISLVEKYSYRVIASAATASNLPDDNFSERPRLIVLGAAAIDHAMAQGAFCRRRWPECKIVLMYDHAGTEEMQKLSASEIDGCMPVSVSPETLGKVLDLVMCEQVMVMLAPLRRLQHPSQ